MVIPGAIPTVQKSALASIRNIRDWGSEHV